MLCHQYYYSVTTKHTENNQNIIYVNNPDKKKTSNTAVNIAAAFHIFIQIIGHANKQLPFLFMDIANMNSETSTINCWFDFARKYRFSW